MKNSYNFGEVWQQKNVVLALGAFDAFHRGHLSVLQKANAVTLFRPLPSQIFSPHFKGLLHTHRQRVEICAKLGIKGFLNIDFSQDFSKMEGDTFLNEIVRTVSPVALVCGADFRLGYHQGWNAEKIALWAKEHRLQCEVEPLWQEDVEGDLSCKVSSSVLRSLIQEGKIEQANALMISPYSLDLESLPYFYDKVDEETIYDLTASEQVIPPDGFYRTKAGIVEILGKELATKKQCKEITFIKCL